MIVAKFIGWYFGVQWRIVKLIIAKVFVSPATGTPKAKSVDEIVLQDMIDALDGQIAVLNEERKIWQEKADQCNRQEQKVKYQKRVADIEVKIAATNKKVMRWRDELEKIS